jgi:Domain of unknown function (DUF4157)
MNSLLHKNSFASLPVMPISKTKQLLQTKLTINTPGDKYEQEADAMADRVMHMSSNETAKPVTGLIGTSLQRKCAHCEEAEKSKKPVMLKAEAGNSGMPVSSSFATSLNASKDGGSPLPQGTKSFMENAFSTDFSGVRIHANNQSSEMSKGINAKAFTYGNDIYFNSGQFSPNADSGKHLLAHELTHTIQQQNNQIHRVPMPDETTVTNLESYTENTRQNIIYDDGFNLQSGISLYFQKGLVRDVRPGYNVTFAVKGFGPTETWVEPAMKALALYNFDLNIAATDPAITNLTTVQHLDMTGETNPADTAVTGPDALVRFTSTKFDKTGKGKDEKQNVQVLIEKMGNFSARVVNEKPADRKARYETTYQITNAVPINTDPLADPNPAQMSDARFDIVLQALDIVPTTILSQATGIPIHMGLTARGPKSEIAEYRQTKAKGSDVWERRITAYSDFFSSTMTTEQRAFTMAHEFGHALDHRPNEGLKGKGGPVLSADTAKGSFGEALKLDGGVKKGVSTYEATKKSEDEYFAEAFTMYINQPNTLKALRPHIYAYFLAKYP